MRLPRLFPLLPALLYLCACGSPPPAVHKWQTAFWYWSGSATLKYAPSQPVDALFVQVGTIGEGATAVNGVIPNRLPAAQQYWLVFRYEKQGVPELGLAPAIAQELSRLLAVAQGRNLKIAGVQLDIDSPTKALPQYAVFLRAVRADLPQGVEISITALLDWFRPGTAIAQVVAEADEFVPQFYDVAEPGAYPSHAPIAARVEASKWGPVFNRFGKRFRIGVSTFGRARLAPKQAPGPGSYASTFYGDLAPIDIAPNPGFRLQVSRTAALETVLSYQALRSLSIGYNNFKVGDAVQFTLASAEAVRAAVDSARQMGGQMAGVVFFRWPSKFESLAMQPEEALAAAGLSGGPRAKSQVRVVDGHCAAVKCMDVYLEGAEPVSPNPARYRIRASTELEYFLPEKNMPVKMAGPSELDLSLPPYCGRGLLYLGRAVSLNDAGYTVERVQ